MRAQFVRGVDPKKSMELGKFDPKTRKNFLSDICQEIMAAFHNLILEKNLDVKITPSFYFEGPVEEWKTEVDLKRDWKSGTYFIMWEDGRYVAGVSGDSLIRSEHEDLTSAINQIRKLL